MKGEGAEGLYAGERYQQSCNADDYDHEAERNRQDLEGRRVGHQRQADEEQ